MNSDKAINMSVCIKDLELSNFNLNCHKIVYLIHKEHWGPTIHNLSIKPRNFLKREAFFQAPTKPEDVDKWTQRIMALRLFLGQINGALSVHLSTLLINAARVTFNY